jgi:uncharacterized membrane protein
MGNSASKRLILSLTTGVVAAIAVSHSQDWKYSPLVGWDTAALIYIIWIWAILHGMNPSQTKSHAVSEDPSRAIADLLLIGASLASLVAVGVLIAQAGQATDLAKHVEIFLSLFSVIISWGVVQTVHILKYAKMYYDGTEGGIDFNESAPPRYSDFAYLAFTLGMTFQVSDTDIKTKEIRLVALKHSLLSYIFGAVIIATTINTIASLGK